MIASRRRAATGVRTPAPGTAAAVMLLLGLWQIGHVAYGTLVLPSPLETVRTLWTLAIDGALLPAVLRTAGHALGGFLAAVLVGGVFGALAGLWTPARHLLQPIATLALGVPAIAWVVLALIWFGGSGLAVAFTVLVTTAPIVFAAAVQGVVTLDGGLRRMARSFRAPWHVLIVDVYLPHMFTHLFPALATALAMSWKVAVMTELLSGTGGIGDGLAAARVQVDTAAAMAWILAVVVLLMAQDRWLLEPLRARLETWRRELPEPAGSTYRSPGAA